MKRAAHGGPRAAPDGGGGVRAVTRAARPPHGADLRAPAAAALARGATRTEALLVVALFLVGIGTRLATRSHVLYHWDSVNFALALERYDIAAHQPHPPGYVLYVLLGRLVNAFVEDANASLVLISVVASGLLIPTAYLLGRDLFDRRTGLYAALLALTGPLVWFYGSVALSYIVELLLTGTIAWLCYHSLEGRRGYLLAASVTLAIAGGVRQNTLPLMLPLWLFCVARADSRWRVGAVLGLVVPSLAWGVAMLRLSGGLEAYLRAVLGQAGDTAVASGLGSATRVLTNWARLTVYAAYALTLGVAVLPPLALAGLRGLPRHLPRRLARPRWQVLGLWVAPSALLYSLFVQQAGYSFTFMLALILLVAYGLRRLLGPGGPHWLRGRDLSPYALALVIACNLAFFVAAPLFLFGQRRQLLSAPSLPAIRQRDRSVRERVALVRSTFDSASTLIVASSFDFRLPDYYLRDYRRLSAVEEAGAGPTAIEIPDEIDAVILFDEDLSPAPSEWPAREATLPSGAALRWLSRDAGQDLILSGTTISLSPSGGRP